MSLSPVLSLHPLVKHSQLKEDVLIRLFSTTKNNPSKSGLKN